MQTIISVLKAALAIRRETFVTENGESRGISIIRSTVRAKFLSKSCLTTGKRLTERNLSPKLGILKNTVHRIFKDDLHANL